jgi:DNA-binding Lrp family transcriptional regulator
LDRIPTNHYYSHNGALEVHKEPGTVTPVTIVTGNYDYLLQVEVTDLPAYEDFHANRLASLPGVAAVTSYVTMKTLPADTA